MLLRFCPSTRAMWSLGIGKFYSTVTETKKWMKDLNECEDFSCSVKSKLPLSNTEVGATEDLHDGN